MSRTPAFTPEELRQFPQPLVDCMWGDLGDRLRNPVKVREEKGLRVVEVLSCVRYLVMPTARRIHMAYGTGRGGFRVGETGGSVAVDPVLDAHLWASYFAADWLVTRGAPVNPENMHGFVNRIRKAPAFRQLLDRIRNYRITSQLRQPVAGALNLDRLVLARARSGLTRGREAVVRSNHYTAAWCHLEGFEQIERENPQLLRPYAGAAVEGLLGRHPEPVRDLKLAMRQVGIGDAGWRLLLTANPATFEAAIRHSENPGVLDAYCWVLKASLVADWVPSPTVMNRLVMPNAREPGERTMLLPDLLEMQFWPPFLRALERRIADIATTRELHEFLDGEFEDVYDWLEREGPEIDANQARAGWPWMLRQCRDWQERERQAALAERDSMKWDVPLADFEHEGFRVVPLKDAYELWEEGCAMRHCARTYAASCRKGETILFSIRGPDGGRMATGSIKSAWGRWTVDAVRLFANRPAGRRILEVARAYASACGRVGSDSPMTDECAV